MEKQVLNAKARIVIDETAKTRVEVEITKKQIKHELNKNKIINLGWDTLNLPSGGGGDCCGDKTSDLPGQYRCVGGNCIFFPA